MWINAEKGADSNCTACDAVTAGRSHCYLTGTSATPAGPFEYHGPVAVLTPIAVTPPAWPASLQPWIHTAAHAHSMLSSFT